MSRVATKLTRILLAQPETGMGYQIVEVWLGRERAEHALVLNAEEAGESRSGRLFLFRERSEEPSAARWQGWLADPPSGLRIEVVSAKRARDLGLLEKRAYGTGAGPASDSSVAPSEADEQFMRFSAFETDRRIGPDGSVLAGTYVTTWDDGYTYAKTGMDAVRRYSLPNPSPAVHRFHLRPLRRIDVRRGIVQPAYGHPGGGAEVIFENGAPAGTLFDKDQIPPGV